MGTPALIPGQPAPRFQLQAVVSQRLIDPAQTPAQALVLTFHDQHALDAIRELQTAVRTAYPTAAEVLMASVADVSRVPRPLRRLVKPFMERAYAEAATYVPAGLDPADYVIILPDWSGETTKRYGVGKEPYLVVIDRDGRVVGDYRGRDLGRAALALLAGVTG